MNDRLSTGNRHLDAILNGGLSRNSINLIAGTPGSGKTVLSQQIAFTNGTREHPALYLSTLSEPLDKIVRYGEEFRFFDREAIRDGRVIFQDVGPVLGQQGLDQVVVSVDRYLKDLQPSVVVIDSFRIFHFFAHDVTVFRQFLYELTRRFTASATTSIWNAPYTPPQALETAEFAVADGIIALEIKQVAGREVRALRVLKLRGSSYWAGEHAYRISVDGFRVFPRLADTSTTAPDKSSSAPTLTGITALDRMLGGEGRWSGAATLVAGPSGVGKTLLGLQYLYRGANSGEAGIIATFNLTMPDLSGIVNGFKWSTGKDNVRAFHRSAAGMQPDEWAYGLLELADEISARRIVVDSLPDLITAIGDPVRFRDWMASLARHCERRGIGLMLLMETPDLFQVERASDEGVSHIADNVIILQYQRHGSRLDRVITVLKTRGTSHESLARRFDIASEGFVLGDVASVPPSP